MFKREHRYIVLKIKDVVNALNGEEWNTLCKLTNKVCQHRINNGKTGLNCVVIENDWPEYEPVWKMIEDRMNKQ